MTDSQSLVQVSSDATFSNDIASGIVLVDFWAEWCGPCQIMLPRLQELAANVVGVAKIMKLDVDSNPTTASGFRIMSIPTMLIFKDGQLVDKFVGVQSVADIEAKIRAI